MNKSVDARDAELIADRADERKKQKSEVKTHHFRNN